jgi:hypothetical protein
VCQKSAVANAQSSGVSIGVEHSAETLSAPDWAWSFIGAGTKRVRHTRPRQARSRSGRPITPDELLRRETRHAALRVWR